MVAACPLHNKMLTIIVTIMEVIDNIYYLVYWIYFVRYFVSSKRISMAGERFQR